MAGSGVQLRQPSSCLIPQGWLISVQQRLSRLLSCKQRPCYDMPPGQWLYTSTAVAIRFQTSIVALFRVALAVPGLGPTPEFQVRAGAFFGVSAALGCGPLTARPAAGCPCLAAAGLASSAELLPFMVVAVSLTLAGLLGGIKSVSTKPVSTPVLAARPSWDAKAATSCLRSFSDTASLFNFCFGSAMTRCDRDQPPRSPDRLLSNRLAEVFQPFGLFTSRISLKSLTGSLKCFQRGAKERSLETLSVISISFRQLPR